MVKAGVRQTTQEPIRIAEKITTARNLRYMTPQALDALAAAGAIRVLDGKRDAAGNVTAVVVERERWVESDTAIVARVLGREIGGKQNVLVMNDEAHHAYRIRPDDGGDEVCTRATTRTSSTARPRSGSRAWTGCRSSGHQFLPRSLRHAPFPGADGSHVAVAHFPGGAASSG